MKTIMKPIAMALLMSAASASWAQSAGQWIAKVGVNQITPQVVSEDLSPPAMPGSKVDVDADMRAIATVTYMYTDHISVEGYLGLPYKHQVVGAGAMSGLGRIGDVRQVSPSVFVQYRAEAADARVRPYIGLGLTAAYFYGIEGSGTLTAATNPGGSPTQLTLDKRFKLALSPQVGLSIKVKDRWILDVTAIKTLISNTARLSTGQSVRVKLDPLSVAVSLGYQY